MAYTDNIIPAMTSATAPSGVVSASSILGSPWDCWGAFDHDQTEVPYWHSAGNTGWLQYQFPAGHIVTCYAVSPRAGESYSRQPRSWTFEGSHDGAAWTVLDTQADVTDWALPTDRKVFELSDAVAYAYYRLDITESNDASGLAVGELEMMETIIDFESVLAAITALGAPMQAEDYTAPDNASAVAAAASAASVDGKLTAARAGYLDEPVSAAKTLTSAYDAAKTAAAPGANMVATNMVAAAPLATANAAAVRTNLGTELARIDENVSAAKTLTSGERTSIASAVSGLANTGLAKLRELLDAVLAKTNTIGTGSAIVISPITASGTITIEQGDSYPAGRSRAIDVNVDDTAHVKGLDDAEHVTVYLLATQFTWTASSVTETAGGYLVRFEPTIAQTAVLRTDRQSYKLKACIDNMAPTDDDAETIQRGTVVRNRDIPAVT